MILTIKNTDIHCIFSFLFFSLTAHMNKTVPTDDACQLPKKSVPLSTQEDLEQEIPAIVEETLKTISADKFHQRPSSKHGRTMILISQQLLAVNLIVIHMLLVSSISTLFSPSTDFCSSNFLVCVNNLRNNPDFLESMLDFILSNVNFKLELRFAKMFAQRFCTCLHTCLRLALGELTGLEFCCTTEF